MELKIYCNEIFGGALLGESAEDEKGKSFFLMGPSLKLSKDCRIESKATSFRLLLNTLTGEKIAYAVGEKTADEWEILICPNIALTETLSPNGVKFLAFELETK